MNNWRKVRLEEITTLITKGTTPTTYGYNFVEEGINFLKIENLNNDNNLLKITPECHEKLKRSQLEENDILFSIAGSLGNTYIVKKDILPCNTNQALAIIRLKDNVDKNYINYFLNGPTITKVINGLKTVGAQPNLSLKQVGGFNIDLPSLKEQQKIAEILSSVDAAIEKTEQVIAKVEEVKKGLMQQLLTKGIGQTEFKQTEVGLIPSSWRVEKLKSVSQNIFVGIATSTTDYFCNRNQGVPLLRNQNIKENYLDLTDLVYITNDFSEKNRNKKLQKNDVIIVRTGYPGVASVVHDDLEGAQTFTTLVVRPCQEYIYSKYLSYYINSEKGKKFVLGGQAGGAQQNLNVSVLEKMPIPIPSINEQISIVHKLDNIDNVKNKNYKKLDLLNKLKQGLMQQLLTGQVRVKMD